MKAAGKNVLTVNFIITLLLFSKLGLANDFDEADSHIQMRTEIDLSGLKITNLSDSAFKDTPMTQSTPDQPAALYPCSWLAVRGIDTEKLAVRIGLEKATPCNWQSAQRLTNKYGIAAFVSPPINGWVLVAGMIPYGPLKQAEDDPFLHWMRELSKEVDEVQYFGEDNSCPHAAWAMCRDGEIIRAYAFQTDPACRILWNVGPTTEAERELGYLYGDSGRTGAVSYDEYQQWLPNEQATDEVAKRWSLSPRAITEGMGEPSLGLKGRVRASWPMREQEEEAERDEGVEETTPGDVTKTVTVMGPGPDLTPEQQAAAFEEMESFIRSIDAGDLIELYCRDKRMDIPEDLRGAQIDNFAGLQQAFMILACKSLPIKLPDEMMQVVGATTAAAALKHYKDQVRKRT